MCIKNLLFCKIVRFRNKICSAGPDRTGFSFHIEAQVWPTAHQWLMWLMGLDQWQARPSREFPGSSRGPTPHVSFYPGSDFPESVQSRFCRGQACPYVQISNRPDKASWITLPVSILLMRFSESAVLPIKLPKKSSEFLLLPWTSDDPKFSHNSSPNSSETLTSFLLGATSPLQSLRIRWIFAVFPSVQAYDAREWLGSSYNFLYLPEVYKRLIFLHHDLFIRKVF